MGWKCLWQILCESCGKAGPVAEAATAEPQAIAEGWRAEKKHGVAFHLCPQCAEKTPGWWPGWRPRE